MDTISAEHTELLLRLAPNVRLVERSGNRLMFSAEGGHTLQVDAHFAGVADALIMVTEGRAEPATLRAIASPENDLAPLDHFHRCLLQLKRAGWCEYVWQSEGCLYAIINSVCSNFEFTETVLKPDTAVTLSRFAYVRRDGPVAVLESPEALCRIVLAHSQTWQWLGLLTRPYLLAPVHNKQGPLATQFLGLLWQTGFLEPCNESEPASRSTWEFHDLLFHWRTREGRTVAPQGGTYRHLHSRPPPPAIKPRMSSSVRLLPKPTIEEVERSDGLISIIEKRRTIRDQGPKAVCAAQISRLLYHSLRVQQRLPGEYQELLLRPVPAAGAIHEIEAYVAVNLCDDLERGLYHYHPEQHTLHQLGTGERDLAALLHNAAMAWAKPDDPPHVLIILTSRFTRLAWKYEGIAYRLTLLNAGAVLQCLYLLATEMRLACAAIGGGDSAIFASATGLDPFAETSIAEFAIGAGP
jgi:SagB-type dehydrogenase family enzyme